MKFYVVPLAFFAARCVGTATAAGIAPIPEQAAISFETHVRPILRAYCFDCHGANDKPEGGLDLRLAAADRERGRQWSSRRPRQSRSELVIAAGSCRGNATHR